MNTVNRAARAARSFMANPILMTDSYKLGHFLQYPPETEYTYFYVEARGSRIEGVDETVFFGLQGFLKAYLSEPLTQQDVDQAAEFAREHGQPFNTEGFQYILDNYAGFWPVEIRAVPEGLPVRLHTPLVTVVNTDPACYWVPSFLETSLMRACWYGTSVATLSRTCKQILAEAMDKTCDDPLAKLPFMLHDFGARGVSSFESSAIGGAGHLINFQGTDTLAGISYARDYYDAPMAGFSIPAAEHSTITTWGRDGEEQAYANMIKHFAKPGALFAVVSDSYDLEGALRRFYGDTLKDKIVESGATLVVRPDSGVPEMVVCRTLETLMEFYGYRVNDKGFKVLPDCIRVIQGDGINVKSLPRIVEAMIEHKLSLDNIAFGMGGGLLQQLNRDTFLFAMKCSAARIGGQWQDVYKDPADDSNKRSKAGRVTSVVDRDGQQQTRLLDTVQESDTELLELVWRNGELKRDLTFDEVRTQAQIALERG